MDMERHISAGNRINSALGALMRQRNTSNTFNAIINFIQHQKLKIKIKGKKSKKKDEC